jgi:hypothetical protein
MSRKRAGRPRLGARNVRAIEKRICFSQSEWNRIRDLHDVDEIEARGISQGRSAEKVVAELLRQALLRKRGTTDLPMPSAVSLVAEIGCELDRIASHVVPEHERARVAELLAQLVRLQEQLALTRRGKP